MKNVNVREDGGKLRKSQGLDHMTPPPAPKRRFSPPVIKQIASSDLSPRDRLRFAQAKYLYFWDNSESQRQNLLDKVFPEESNIKRIPLVDDVIPGGIDGTDLLLIGGDDHRAVGQFLSRNDLLTRRVPKIVLIKSPTIAQKVTIFRAGADSVFDVANMCIDETRAEIAAIWRRYLLARKIANQDQERKAMIEEYTTGSLTYREEQIATFFIENFAKYVSLRDLKSISEIDRYSLSDVHIRILIGRLRKKLRDDYQILNQPGIGYMLALR